VQAVGGSQLNRDHGAQQQRRCGLQRSAMGPWPASSAADPGVDMSMRMRRALAESRRFAHANLAVLRMICGYVLLGIWSQSVGMVFGISICGNDIPNLP